mgnify:CR=1 FL=1|jgi:uncharacterized protein YozE (UPF0346 family)
MISFYDFLMLNDTSNNGLLSHDILSVVAEVVKEDQKFPKNVIDTETLVDYFFNKNPVKDLGHFVTIAICIYEYFVSGKNHN